MKIEKLPENMPLIPDHGCFTVLMGDYLLNVKMESVKYNPTVSDEVLVKCSAIEIKQP